MRNTGQRAGSEVAELYLTPPPFDGAPRIALRGFQRLALAPGESRQLSFDLSQRDLSFVDHDGHREIMTGAYRLSVGSGQPADTTAVQSADFTVATKVVMAR